MEKLPISSVILAGGQAKRFNGQDKGLIKFNEHYLIEYVLSQLRPQVTEIIISANRHLEQYRQLGCPVVTDTIGDYWGPLAGIASTLSVIQTPYLLVTPCDCPLLTANFASQLLTALSLHSADISVAHDGTRIQPLFALLHYHLLENLLEYLHHGQRAVKAWYDHHRVVTVDFSGRPDIFFNVNTPDDLQRLQQQIVRSKF